MAEIVENLTTGDALTMDQRFPAGINERSAAPHEIEGSWRAGGDRLAKISDPLNHAHF